MIISLEEKQDALKKLLARYKVGHFFNSPGLTYYGLCSVSGDLLSHLEITMSQYGYIKMLIEEQREKQKIFYDMCGDVDKAYDYLWSLEDRVSREKWIVKHLQDLKPKKFTSTISKILRFFKSNLKKLAIALFLTLTSLNTFAQEYDEVTATVYNAVVEQTNNDSGHTASMFKLDLSNPYKHRIIAVSRDLLEDYPMGTKVKISGTKMYDGIYEVQDKMNKRWKRRIDILINKGMRLGKWNKVKIVKL